MTLAPNANAKDDANERQRAAVGRDGSASVAKHAAG
jgi:hypothetical protein